MSTIITSKQQAEEYMKIATRMTLDWELIFQDFNVEPVKVQDDHFSYLIRENNLFINRNNGDVFAYLGEFPSSCNGKTPVERDDLQYITCGSSGKYVECMFIGFMGPDPKTGELSIIKDGDNIIPIALKLKILDERDVSIIESEKAYYVISDVYENVNGQDDDCFSVRLRALSDVEILLEDLAQRQIGTGIYDKDLILYQEILSRFLGITCYSLMESDSFVYICKDPNLGPMVIEHGGLNYLAVYGDKSFSSLFPANLRFVRIPYEEATDLAINHQYGTVFNFDPGRNGVLKLSP